MGTDNNESDGVERKAQRKKKARRKRAELKEFIEKLKDRGTYSPKNFSSRIESVLPNFPATGLVNLMSRQNSLEEGALGDLIEHLPLILYPGELSDLASDYEVLSGINPVEARASLIHRRGYNLISRHNARPFNEPLLEGDYLIYRANSPSGGISRSGLRIRPLTNFGLRTNTVRLDGDLQKISTQGILIDQTNQFLVVAYTRLAKFLEDPEQIYDGGMSIMALSKTIRGRTPDPDKIFDVIVGIHLQAPYEYHANLSRVVIVRDPNAPDPNTDFASYTSEMLEREDLSEPLTVEEAAKELSSITNMKKEFFYSAETISGEVFKKGALVNTAPDGEAINAYNWDG